MTANLDAKNLTLRDVQRILKFEEHLNASTTSLLTLEPLTQFEQQELLQIRNLFRDYYAEGKISEGQVKFLFVARLMWLAGFYQPSIKITLEEGIADISIEDEETIIKGRMDILAINKTQATTDTLFWILVIETKNSSINALEGLPQLLAYAYKSLEYQESVWGLTTNGMDYRFAYLQQGISPTYQLLPALNLIDSEPSIQLLQVLKAICKLQNIATPVQAVS
ncbi:restriction endonuclease subunit R [Trichocoleus sp. FACHB-90]|uniref:restriction endonuclease subunit R n=1 Tax=Cyanophyceae TaxID=3028117 RepID=UPI00168465CA|nr:restriction endonuclease subunit R [Trichocoleus sp. FACHB-90]MBD1927339.1 restriction endonuclease subunit R [Trichocoleus sp. FACHB-90]